MEVRHDPEAGEHRTREHASDTRRKVWEDTDRSVGQVVGDLTSQVAHLARVEAKLAAREAADQAKRGMVGGGLFAVAAVIAIYGGAGLAGAAVFALALVWPGWLAALVVGVVLFALAGIVSAIARAKLRRTVQHPAPEDMMDRAREDVQAIRGRMDER
ncbi:phage holin family protein [Glycomyces buryatensis]|nr:phage holin family protein [Glycomyces buryatensis]